MQVISPELARDLARLSFESGRQIGLLLARDGTVEMVLVGGARSLFIPDLPKSREGRSRLRGLRLVHTHLEEDSLTQDDLMDLVFLRLDCVAAVRVDRHGGATQLEVAHLVPSAIQPGAGWDILPLMPCYDPDLDFQKLVQSLEEEFDRARLSIPAEKQEDRAILVSVTSADRETARQSMDELVELAHASGIVAADVIIQRLRDVSRRTLIGKGKLSEIVLRALQCGVDLLIFDQDLNPSQVKAITDTTELRVIDRTQLILDIFAQRAQSREGKIQVEMAQLKYLLPRLGVKDDALSRLTGGIGTRGPGETTLEINRRRTKDRIAHLERQLDVVRKNRGQRRSRRARKELPTISIVGYTNAGKSTLLNTLTQSAVFVQDKLFATLDPSSRRLRFPEDREFIIRTPWGSSGTCPRISWKPLRRPSRSSTTPICSSTSSTSAIHAMKSRWQPSGGSWKNWSSSGNPPFWSSTRPISWILSSWKNRCEGTEPWPSRPSPAEPWGLSLRPCSGKSAAFSAARAN